MVRPKTPPRPFGKPAAARQKSATSRLAIRPAVLYAGFAFLVSTNVLTLIGFLMAPDIARVFSPESQSVLGAYEDRLSQLRLEVDRLQSRHYAQAGDVNLQLQELAQQQEVLVEQHQYVKQLADKAAALGISADSLPKAANSPAPAAPASGTDDTLLTGSIGGATGQAAQIAAAAASINRMMGDSQLALATLDDVASTRTNQILGTLAAVGIKPKLPGDEDAEGGPLLPPLDGTETASLVDDANSVATALDQYKAALDAADIAPVHAPVQPNTRISSTFGNRTDPFTGRLAFHPGIDFAAPWGTTVFAAGAGTVSFVGQINGYGNAVEITHADGLVSLYGHLSSFIATVGEIVDVGTPIAHVGSTGRSTGPHLHFELRRGDNSIDPAPFLAAGRVLGKIIAIT
ncbi:MAG TPA: M23 family metallopeptidase [Devosia sp.]|nr:M23 family metallopeptidase [Devosia sp.]